MSKKTLIAIGGYMVSMLPLIWLFTEWEDVMQLCYPDITNNRRLILNLSLIIVLLVWVYLHTIVHELGHLVAGLMNDYQFVSFRIGSLTLLKIHGQYEIRHMRVPGTAGQCLMAPPPSERGEIDDVWYLLGGGLANLLVASVLMYLYGTVTVSGVSFCICFTGAAIGLFLALRNLLPMKTSQMSNDGYDILFGGRNRLNKQALYYLLALNAAMQQSEKPEDMESLLYQKVTEFPYADLTELYQANLYYQQIFLYMAKGEYAQAWQCADTLCQTRGVLDLFRNEASLYLLYHAIMNQDTADEQAHREEIDRRYQETTRYRKQMAWDPKVHMLEYAYRRVYTQEEAKAAAELVAVRQTLKKSSVGLEQAIVLAELARIQDVVRVNEKVDIENNLLYNIEQKCDDEEK